MANEKRVRVNAIGGLIEDNPLTISATTLTSAGLAPLPVVDTTNYVALVLDPDGLESAPEIAYVTAHTANATTATILRAQEGTTAIAHSVDVPWVHAPTVRDFVKDVDSPWSGDTLTGGPYDQEFDADGSPTGLPSGWSWVNQGAATYIEEWSTGHIACATTAADNLRVIVRSLPTGNWTVTAKVSIALNSENYNAAYAMILRESSSGKMYGYGVNFQLAISLVNWSSPTVAVGNVVQDTNPANRLPLYWRIKRNSSTSFDLSYSQDGIAWRALALATNLSYLVADQVGFGISTYGAGKPLEAACHWMRIR